MGLKLHVIISIVKALYALVTSSIFYMLTVLLVSKNVQCTRNFDRVSKKPKKNILAINLAHFDDYLANTLFNHSLNSLNISFEKVKMRSKVCLSTSFLTPKPEMKFWCFRDWEILRAQSCKKRDSKKIIWVLFLWGLARYFYELARSF